MATAVAVVVLVTVVLVVLEAVVVVMVMVMVMVWRLSQRPSIPGFSGRRGDRRRGQRGGFREKGPAVCLPRAMPRAQDGAASTSLLNARASLHVVYLSSPTPPLLQNLQSRRPVPALSARRLQGRMGEPGARAHELRGEAVTRPHALGGSPLSSLPRPLSPRTPVGRRALLLARDRPPNTV